MRRPRVLLSLTAVGLAGVLATTGCGIIADDTAATVGDTVIPASEVDALARNDAFTTALTAQAIEDQQPGVLDGASARQVLSFLITTEVQAQEVARFGVAPTGDDLEAAKAQAEQRIDEQAPRLEGHARDVVLRYLVDGAALQQALADIDPSSDEDLRTLYDGVPSYWDQVCMAAIVVPADDVAAARKALAGGAELEEVVDDVEGSNLAATPDQCLPLKYLPEGLADRIGSARTGRLVGPVEGAIEGEDSVVWFEVESKPRLSFEDARDQLEQIAQAAAQSGPGVWLNIRVNEHVTIDPQYGSRTVTSQGSGLTVVPPATPIGAAAPSGSPDDVTAGAAGATP
ncbi:peptidylprolyl isomerase [Dermatobacter hominis]|uniref:peptidylprolyl isomerase n=1 Tax=Dermatobacter hominis TaxID=2884263 RepID=UPI001D0FCBC8|nr:peptidylprolyl isomerase [Dermatobacter hominis]UDY37693.1 hypothetical protein LH044_09165 [Dermatobacter hominis]